MRRHGFTLLQALSILALVMVLAAILFPILGRKRGSSRISCQSNLKQIALGCKQYVQDNDERWPLASSGRAFSANTPFGWADAIQPYVRSLQLFQCPFEPTRPKTALLPTQIGYTDYWYNANCAGQHDKSFISVMNTVLSGDGAVGGGDARYSVTRETNTTEDTSRRLGGNEFVFVDGHAKWIKIGEVSATSSPKSRYSFNIR